MITAIAGRVNQFATLFSLKPFDGSSEQGRARERYRRVALSAIAAAAAKLVTVGTTLISVPLTLHYLGAERYGMWMAMSSVIAMLSFADLGMGNGILNAVAESHGRDDRQAIRRYVSSGYFILGVIGTLFGAAFAVAYPHVGWDRLFNVQSPVAQTEAGPAIAVLAFAFAINIPLAIVQRVQAGLQQSFTANLWQCLGSVLGLAGVLVAIGAEAALPWLVAAMVGGPIIATMGNTIHFFGVAQPDLLPVPRYVATANIHRISHTGIWFLALQISVALAYASDSFVISQVLGASAVTKYAVPEKMFALISVLVGMALGPLWPAYGEAIARGDSKWAQQTLRRSVVGAITVAALIASLLVLLGNQIVSSWVGPAVNPPLEVLLVLGIWKVMEAAGSALGMFLNGANFLRLQAVLSFFMAAAAIGLKFVLVQRIGVSGAVLATILCYAAFVLAPWTFIVPSITRNLALKGAKQ